LVSVRSIFLCCLGMIAAGQIAAAIVLWLDGSTTAVATCFIVSFAAFVAVMLCSIHIWRELLEIVCSLNTATGEIIERSKYGVLSGLAAAINKSLNHCRDRIGSLNRQAGDLAVQIQLLQHQKRTTEEIIYSIRDAVVVTDTSEKVLLANHAAGRLFGFDSRNTKLKSVSELTDNQEFVQVIRQSRQSKTSHVKHEICVKQGEIAKIYDCSISCIYDDNDLVTGVVAVLHDITREKEISQMKNDFVSHVSHELKTPLASITAYAEMLVDGEAQDETTRNEFYSVIQAQAQRLNRLIEDILNISRIESGLMKVNKEPVSMTILIRDAVQMIKSYADQKNITVNQQTPIVFDQVYADKDMISQVIINLLSNAVKYTPSGGSIHVGSEVDDADGTVRITVTDNGVGIPANDLPHVFDKFFRVAANNKCAKGTGLGLNLVKQIVEKVHDGHVFVTSEAGKGSTFGFELPLGVEQTVGVA
jgi:two-component system, OmpR family, phosphate regulon sensor histidine kinase PhoR